MDLILLSKILFMCLCMWSLQHLSFVQTLEWINLCNSQSVRKKNYCMAGNINQRKGELQKIDKPISKSRIRIRIIKQGYLYILCLGILFIPKNCLIPKVQSDLIKSYKKKLAFINKIVKDITCRLSISQQINIFWWTSNFLSSSPSMRLI